MAPYEQKAWTNVSAGLMNIGGLRVPLNRGSKYELLSGYYNLMLVF